MEKKWILRAAVLLTVYLTKTLAAGQGDRSSLDSNNTSSHSHATELKKLEGFRNESVELNRTVTLLCTDTKIAWDNMIYVIWTIIMDNRNCTVADAVNETKHNTCQDGKKINISADGLYTLIIPKFSFSDEGNYICDLSLKGGGIINNIQVSAWAHPVISGWLEVKDGHTFAICEVQSKPEASIRWETAWDSSAKTYSSQAANGLFTVRSHLELPQNVSHKNMTCVATAFYPNRREVQFRNFESKGSSVKWPFILLGVCATCSIVTLLTGLFIMREKLVQLSLFRKICCTPKISTPTEEKKPELHYTEEVEPYASYVQRVNSIYNSSAELFNA